MCGGDAAVERKVIEVERECLDMLYQFSDVQPAPTPTQKPRTATAEYGILIETIGYLETLHSYLARSSQEGKNSRHTVVKSVVRDLRGFKAARNL
ncbi:hypothetical protein DPX39_090037900 [Trypanosoma brucei equiperdum]|uniref:Uncharacterized protein n=1 Tax=Trypanosoma brucei equiperdum TaxID=630700 RepID=A0A3L6L1E6_9TRYP|nr:hypothetical protein DPX39_090037900 [Trypanosoma brucei equiperdum]